MAVRKRDDEVVFPNAAGIDVGASSHWVAVPRQATDDPVREFGAMTDDLNAMADWLIGCGVDTVALESTGVYWIPVYEVLEQHGLKVWLVDVRQMKYVPGRKSDVQDCQWLQKLMSLGLLRAAWRPDGEVCVVVQMNLQLTEVLTDVMGMTGQAIIRAIVAGERDPKVLARHRNGRVKASAAEITKALTGNWRDEHLFVLKQALAMYDDIARHLAECDAKLQALLGELGQRKVDLGKAPRAGGKSRTAFDARQTLANWAGVDLTRINGLGLAAVMKILSEIGPDLSRFANVKHFCSWLGLCPGTKISGGKMLSAKTKRSANRVRQALKMAAMSLSHSNSALGAFYRRLCSRMDKPSANTATAHKLARMVYFMLTRGEDFVDKGQQHYEEQQRQRSIAALRRRAAALGGRRQHEIHRLWVLFLVRFGRFAAEQRAERGLGKPETFNFLGFTHISGRTQKGSFILIRKSRRDRMQAKLRAIKDELRQRMHDPIPQQGQWLRQVVRGYLAYHAVPTNLRSLAVFRHFVERLWLNTLRRRSQKDRFSWARMARLAADWLPSPRILHAWPDVRFAVNHPR